jgi:hypothetical protein
MADHFDTLDDLYEQWCEFGKNTDMLVDFCGGLSDFHDFLAEITYDEHEAADVIDNFDRYAEEYWHTWYEPRSRPSRVTKRRRAASPVSACVDKCVRTRLPATSVETDEADGFCELSEYILEHLDSMSNLLVAEGVSAELLSQHRAERAPQEKNWTGISKEDADLLISMVEIPQDEDVSSAGNGSAMDIESCKAEVDLPESNFKGKRPRVSSH